MNFFYKLIENKKSVFAVFIIAFIVRLINGFYGSSSSQFTILDEIGFYQWSWDMYYYSAAWFGTYLPGPWQSVMGYIFLHLFNGVAGLTILGICLGILEVGLMYRLGYLVGGLPVAFWSALLTAVMPYSIRFTSSFWNPNFVIPLSTLSFIALIEMSKRQKSAWIFVYVLAFGLMPFFHAYPTFVVPMAIVALFILKIKPSLSYLVFGLVAVAILYFPFLFMDYKNNWYIIGGVFRHSAGTVSERIFYPESLKFVSNLFAVTSTDVSRFVGLNWETYKYFLSRYYPHYIMGLVLILPSLLLSIFSIFSFLKPSNFPMGKRWWIVVIGFLLVPEILFFLTYQPHQERYLINIWPLLFLFPAIYLSKYSVHSQKIQMGWLETKKRLVLGLALIVLTMSFYQFVSLSHYERYPNVRENLRIPPSLVWYENVEKALCQGAGIPWRAGPNDSHYLGKPVSHSFLSTSDRDKSKKPLETISIYKGNFDRTLEKGVEDRRLGMLETWLNYHRRFKVAAASNSKWRVFFTSPGGSLPPEGIALKAAKVGQLPNVDVWLARQIN